MLPRSLHGALTLLGCTVIATAGCCPTRAAAQHSGLSALAVARLVLHGQRTDHLAAIVPYVSRTVLAGLKGSDMVALGGAGVFRFAEEAAEDGYIVFTATAPRHGQEIEETYVLQFGHSGWIVTGIVQQAAAS